MQGNTVDTRHKTHDTYNRAKQQPKMLGR